MLALKTGLKYILDIEVIEFADGLDGAGQRERKELDRDNSQVSDFNK